MMTEGFVVVLIVVVSAVVTALAAKGRGRSFGLWLVLGAIGGVFALAALFMMENKAPGAKPGGQTGCLWAIAGIFGVSFLIFMILNFLALFPGFVPVR